MWSMNVVPVTSPDTLPIIFDRGLLGVPRLVRVLQHVPPDERPAHCDHFLERPWRARGEAFSTFSSVVRARVACRARCALHSPGQRPCCFWHLSRTENRLCFLAPAP